MNECRLVINGFEVIASYGDDTVNRVMLPLLRKLTAMRRGLGRRLVVFLAGPPGCGKSTLAAFLEALSLRHEGMEPIQALGIDGFHYHQKYILTHSVVRGGLAVPMKDVKGCPETYDAEKLRAAITALKEGDAVWPRYDRRLHDVEEGSIKANGSIILVEGNWLLLNEGVWAGLKPLCDFSVMLRADAGDLKERLIGRKVRGGLSPEEAARFYEASDKPNVLRCLHESMPADMTLRLLEDGRIESI